MKKLFFAVLVYFGLSMSASAAGGGIAWDPFPADRGTNVASLQNGARIFVNHCLNCHSAAFMRYNRLADIGLTEEQIKANLMFTTEKVGDVMKVSLDPRQLQAWARNFYDNGVLQFDETVHELLSVLDAHGYLRDAVVVITGDHGELLGERGHYEHAKTVLQGVLDIPLLLIRYGYSGEPIPPPRLASQIDIAPTILRELALPVPEAWSGSALQNGVTRPFSYFQQGTEVGLFDLRDGSALWKYWRNVRSGVEEAYRLDLDPDEQRNQIEAVPAELHRQWLRETLPGTTAVSGAARD